MEDKTCLECGGALSKTQPKFCSRSCAAKTNNRLFVKRKTDPKLPCPNCGSAVKGKNVQVYCSNQCGIAHRRQQNLELWLATGIQKAGAFPEGHYVREYIRDDQGGTCEICKCQPLHNGLKLVFRLDHIDGNSENNCRDNLRLICPNCDSQTETFGNKGGRIGQGRFKRRMRYQAGLSY